MWCSSTAQRVLEHCTKGTRALHKGYSSTAQRVLEHRAMNRVHIASRQISTLQHTCNCAVPQRSVCCERAERQGGPSNEQNRDAERTPGERLAVVEELRQVDVGDGAHALASRAHAAGDRERALLGLPAFRELPDAVHRRDVEGEGFGCRRGGLRGVYWRRSWSRSQSRGSKIWTTIERRPSQAIGSLSVVSDKVGAPGGLGAQATDAGRRVSRLAPKPDKPPIGCTAAVAAASSRKGALTDGRARARA